MQDKSFGVIKCLAAFFIISAMLDFLVYLLVTEQILGASSAAEPFLIAVSWVLFIAIFYASVWVYKRERTTEFLGLVFFKVSYLIYASLAFILIYSGQYYLLAEAQAERFANLSDMRVSNFGLIYSVLLIPVAEELVFRGALLSAFPKRYSFILAAFFSSMVWALLHIGKFPLEGMVFLFFHGILLCFLKKYSGSIFPSCLVHIAVNGVWSYTWFFN